MEDLSNRVADHVVQLLADPDVSHGMACGGTLPVRTPITGEPIARMPETGAGDVPDVLGRAHKAFLTWREVPAPTRDESVHARHWQFV
jgi:aldehyde dehydrogenase (NAD+)